MVIHKKTLADRVFDACLIALMLLLCVLTLYPFLFVVSRSVMSITDRALHPFALIPRQKLDFEGYQYIVGQGSRLGRGYLITIFRTVVGTVLSVLLESMFAYALSKRFYPLRKILTVMIALTLWFSAGLIPRFLVVRAIGLFNSIWVYVFLGLFQAWNIIIFRTFFSQIPDSIEESARLDGANEFTILFRLIFPLSTAVLATISLFHIVGHWNEWFSGIVYVTDPNKVPVQVMLYQILREAVRRLRDETWDQIVPPAKSIQMALIVVTAFPIVVAYPFFQKYFVKGMLIGSIKG